MTDFIWAAVGGVMFGDFGKNIENLDSCPLKVGFYGGAAFPEDHEYTWMGRLSIRETGRTEEICEEGYEPGTTYCVGSGLIGDWNFHLALMDRQNNAVVKEGETKWTGILLDGVGHHEWVAEEGGYSRDGLWWYPKVVSPIGDLAKTFLPIGLLIHRYEQLTESAKVDITANPVLSDEKVTVVLSDLFDSYAKVPNPWWRILVEAEKGKILGGEGKNDEGFSIFRVSNLNRIEYQSPDQCQGESEIIDTITVDNTCTMLDANEPNCGNEIASKQFKVLCTNFELEIEKSWSIDSIMKFIPRTLPAGIDVEYASKGIIPLRVIRSADDPSKFQLEGSGTIQGQWTATASGPDGTCVWSFEDTDTYQFGGVYDPSTDPPMLYPKGSYTAKRSRLKLECTVGGPFPVYFPMSQPESGNMGWTLKAEEGDTDDWSMFGITYKATLHRK